MDFYAYEKGRLALSVDHPYTVPFSHNSDEFLLGRQCSECPSSTVQSLDSWVDVDGSGELTPHKTASSQSACIETETARSFSSSLMALDRPSGPSQPWVSNVDTFRRKLFRMLEKCILQASTEKDRFRHLSPFERMHRQNALRDSRLRRIARSIRKAMAALYWCLESCLTLHHWCLTQLSDDDMLQLYCDGFSELWRQGRITSLLSKLNKLIAERDPCLGKTDSPALRVLQLTQGENSSTDSTRLSSHTVIRPLMSTSLFQYRRPAVYSMPLEQPILVCLTYPINRRSERLNCLLRDLGVVGKVSVESPEEQASDRMRMRLWFYVQRILKLLDEAKHHSVYLVGFGVSSILVLRALIHLSSTEKRHEAFNIAGVICIAMPLVGLKGVRGSHADPLLNIPNVPTLIIIGSRSRLGSYRQAVNFRHQLVAAHRSLVGIDSLQHARTVDRNRTNVHILTVNGADHLLRLRLTMRSQWTMLQSEVDKCIVSTVDRFVRQYARGTRMDPAMELDQSSSVQRSMPKSALLPLVPDSRHTHSRVPHSRKLQNPSHGTRGRSTGTRDSESSAQS